jgi:hypothetical protein
MDGVRTSIFRIAVLESNGDLTRSASSASGNRGGAVPRCNGHVRGYQVCGLLTRPLREVTTRRLMSSLLKYAARPPRVDTAETARLRLLISQAPPCAALSDLARPSERSRALRSFQLLARATWCRHKGGYSWRFPRRIGPAIYSLVGAPILQNTCCTSLLGAPSTTSSSVPTPP